MTVQRSSIIKPGDKLKLYHRANAATIRDADGRLVVRHPNGEPFEATVGWVKDERSVHVTAIDATGDHFVEEGVYILQPDEPAPRGGRYAVLVDDDSEHPPEE
jgi:hypothetical protein